MSGKPGGYQPPPPPPPPPPPEKPPPLEPPELELYDDAVLLAVENAFMAVENATALNTALCPVYQSGVAFAVS